MTVDLTEQQILYSPQLMTWSWGNDVLSGHVSEFNTLAYCTTHLHMCIPLAGACLSKQKTLIVRIQSHALEYVQ